MPSPNYDYSYQPGGILAPHEPSYVKREADEALYQEVKQGRFAYVFNCRQMGKSSLRVRTEMRLKAEGVCCAALDLSKDGADQVTAAQWYRTLISELNRILELLQPKELVAWYDRQGDVTPAYRLDRFIDEVLLVQRPHQPITVFVDEIDTVLSLDFPANDFFAWIRACYNRRADNPDYNRLTFVLLGVTTPSQLIRDTTRTPFNIGTAIELTPLPLENAAGLAEGLAGWVAAPQRVLAEIFAWTGGQPYLTQRLCELVQEQAQEADTLPWIAAGDEVAAIAALVEVKLVQNWEVWDDHSHLKTIRDRLLRREALAGRLLGIYGQVLSQGQVPKDNSDAQMELRLSGLVVAQNGHLRVYNPIYQQIFDADWVQRTLDGLRPYAESLTAWKASGYSDEALLLQGQALTEADAWAQSRALSDEDNRYLRASQALETREVRQINQRVEAKRQELEWLSQEAEVQIQNKEEQLQEQNRKIRNRSALATVTLVASLIGGAIAFGVYTELESAQAKLDSAQVELGNVQTDLETREKALTEAEKKLNASENELLANQKEIEEAKQNVADAQQARSVAQAAQQQAEQERLRTSRLAVENLKKAELAQIAYEQAAEQSQQALAKAEFFSRGSEIERNITSLLPGLHEFPTYTYLRGLHQAFALRKLNTDWMILRKQGEFNDPAVNVVIGSIYVLSKLQNKLQLFAESRFTQKPLIIGSYRAEYSLDGKSIVTASGYEAYLWNSQGDRLSTFTGHLKTVSSATFSRDGRYVLTASDDGTARLWDLAGNELKKFEAKSPVKRSQFSYDSRHIVTASDDGIVRIWNLNGDLVKSFPAHEERIWSVVFSHDDRFILTASQDKFARLWDLEGNQVLEIKGHFDWVTSAVFSPDGKNIITASVDSTARIWNLKGEEIQKFEGHGRLWSAVFSHDAQYILTASENRTARLWNTQGDEIQTFEGYDDGLWQAVFSPSDRNILTVSNDGTARIWEISKDMPRQVLSHNADIFRAEYSSDGKYIVTASGHEAHLWDSQSNRLGIFTGHSETVASATFSENGQYVLTASDDGTARLWDLAGNELKKFEAKSPVKRSQFSYNGRYIVTASDDGIVRVWSLEGDLVRSFTAHEGPIWSIVFSHDDRFLLTASQDGFARLWDLEGNQLLDIKGHFSWVTSAVFSADGQKIITASVDSTARIWNLEGEEIQKFEGHGRLWSAVFSHDAQYILTASENGTARLWDIQGNKIQTFEGHKYRLWQAVFSPDERSILTASSDGNARIWGIPTLDLDELIGSGCAWLENFFKYHPGGRQWQDLRNKCDAEIGPTAPSSPRAVRTSQPVSRSHILNASTTSLPPPASVSPPTSLTTPTAAMQTEPSATFPPSNQHNRKL